MQRTNHIDFYAKPVTIQEKEIDLSYVMQCCGENRPNLKEKFLWNAVGDQTTKKF